MSVPARPEFPGAEARRPSRAGMRSGLRTPGVVEGRRLRQKRASPGGGDASRIGRSYAAPTQNCRTSASRGDAARLPAGGSRPLRRRPIVWPTPSGRAPSRGPLRLLRFAGQTVPELDMRGSSDTLAGPKMFELSRGFEFSAGMGRAVPKVAPTWGVRSPGRRAWGGPDAVQPGGASYTSQGRLPRRRQGLRRTRARSSARGCNAIPLAAVRSRPARRPARHGSGTAFATHEGCRIRLPFGERAR